MIGQIIAVAFKLLFIALAIDIMHGCGPI